MVRKIVSCLLGIALMALLTSCAEQIEKDVGSEQSNVSGAAASSEPAQTDEMDEKRLTMETLQELAQKGAQLRWDDFRPYAHQASGEDAFIEWTFTISDAYELKLMGSELNEIPDKVILEKEGDSSIDIRYDDLEAFLRKSNKAEKGNK